MIRISRHAHISSKNVAKKKTLASLYVVDCGLNTSLDVRLLWMMGSINDTSDSIISKFVSSITDSEDLLADLYTTKQLPMMRRRSHMELPAWRRTDLQTMQQKFCAADFGAGWCSHSLTEVGRNSVQWKALTRWRRQFIRLNRLRITSCENTCYGKISAVTLQSD